MNRTVITCSNVRKPLYVLAILRGKSLKAEKATDIGGSVPLLDCRNLLWGRLHPFRGEKVAKICNLGHTNVAFLPSQCESGLGEMVKHFSEVLLMVGRVNQHIV